MNLDRKNSRFPKYILPIVLGSFLLLLVGFYLYREDILRTLVKEKLSTVTAKSTATSSADSKQLSAKKLIVDLEGAVQNPGVYEMEESKRINDVLIAAGGLSGDVDLQAANQTINKAQKLSDGMKIYIPSVKDKPVESTNTIESPSPENKLNINIATKSELDLLPGVGSVTAEKILSMRPYQSLNELIAKKVLNNSQFEKVKDIIMI
jgi:competence protein ComEA